MNRAAGELKGKRIVITRAPEQAQKLVRELQGRGADVLLMPAVKFSSVPETGELDTVLQRISEFDWILFTSQNAVRFFRERCKDVGLNLNSFASCKVPIAAVGPATRDATIQEGFSVDYTAVKHSAEGLADEMRDKLRGRRVLLPRSDRADNRLPKALRNSGADVTELVVYRTIAPDAFDPAIIAAIRKAEVDAIVFASPSAFHNLSDEIGAKEFSEISFKTAFAAIGATTARAMRDAGARCEVEAGDASDKALAKALVKYYEMQASSKMPAARRA
jgi:uroporphyrinogen III methyltransferase/synthase